MRNVEFANGEFYHIYNRGVDKRTIFLNNGDRNRFLLYFLEFNTTHRKNQSLSKSLAQRNLVDENLVDIHAYCLMGNHFHLLLSQNIDGGISKFMQRVGMGYTKFFNFKYNRTGRLFESSYKIKHINTTSYLLQTSAYIHFNPFKLTALNDKKKFIQQYRWSSFKDYAFGRHSYFINQSPVLDCFKDRNDYRNFVFSRLDDHIKTSDHKLRLPETYIRTWET